MNLPQFSMFILLVSLPAFADGGSAEDLMKVTKTPPELQKKKTGLGLSTGCTSASGVTYKQGDPGFDRCIDDYRQRGRAPITPNGVTAGQAIVGPSIQVQSQ